MLNTNYIIKFLSNNQSKISESSYKKIKYFELNKEKIEKINTIEDDPEIDLFTYFNFKINNNIYTNKSPVFTFIYSILYIADNSFQLYDRNDSEKIIKDFVLKIDKELFENNLYNKFGYNINKKFNKGEIQCVLKNAFQFKVSDSFYLLKKYISDYLGINIYILKLLNNNIDVENSEYYISRKFNNINDNSNNKFLPHFILFEENNIYRSLKMDNDDNNSIIVYSKNNDIVDNLWNIFNIKENNNIEIKEQIDIGKEEIKQKEDKDQKDKEQKDKEDKEDKEQKDKEDKEQKDKEQKDKEQKDKEQKDKEDKEQKDKEQKQKEINNIEIKDNNYTEINSINNIKKFTYNNLKKYKIDELKQLCIDNNIDIKKISEKTNKPINKLKDELLSDLLNI